MATNLTAQTRLGNEIPVESPGEIATNRVAEPVIYRRVYVWELPVRIFHWLNAVSIVVLAATGYLIGSPERIFNAAEPSQQYWFGWVRFTHFAFAYIFFLNFLFRIYWSFVGNKWAHWSAYVPYKKSQFTELWHVLTTDIIPVHLRERIAVGHNYLASLTYFFLFIIIILQAITGFALYADMSSFFLPNIFAWVVPLLGGDMQVRYWHHILMWAFIIFTVIHVYLVFYHDWIEGRGTTSSIIGGFKFEKDEDLAE